MRRIARSMFIAAAIAGSTLSLAQPATAGDPTPDINAGVTVNPTSTLPGTTVQATGEYFNLGGSANWQIGLELTGTNGGGTFTAVTPGPGVSNCSIDAVAARTVTCDWNPTMVNESTTVTATITVAPDAGPLPNIWDIFAKEGIETLSTTTLTILATYSGTAEAICTSQGEPQINATNTGTGDLIFVVDGAGFPLPVGGEIVVGWPEDASGYLPQVDWDMLIAGTNDVVVSGTVALPDDCVTDPPATGPGAPAPTAPPPGPNLPETGPANWWIAVMGAGFVLAGSFLHVLRRRPG